MKQNLRQKVETILDYAQRKHGKRMCAILQTESKKNKLSEYGLYDTLTKKYVLFSAYSRNQDEHLKELEEFANLKF